jgi:hypothetical protein
MLDVNEQAFLQRALQPDAALRPTAAQLLAGDPYLKFGPECVAAPAAAPFANNTSRGWTSTITSTITSNEPSAFVRSRAPSPDGNTHMLGRAWGIATQQQQQQ